MNFEIEQNLNKLKSSISDICLSSNRIPNSVKLLAVSKTFPSEYVSEAYKYGQRMFGENKVQELEIKVPVLPKDIEWHLIGHLQSNKVSKAVELADYIHAVDSEKLLKRINNIAGEKNRKPKILLEVNISGEESKFGLTLDKLDSCAKLAKECDSIDFVGFMTMAPFDASPEELSDVFSKMRMTRDRLEKELNVNLPELSMGMSSDYDSAIKEGATIVRVGTAIFGNRTYPTN
ncbi:MAG TPA: YggS family pyridoxal phosphate-dependent enzyme [Victivallales bacterium]|nr:YggS family pyridoxal phosphate-dependent enzyme [Victivallales bacterium]